MEKNILPLLKINISKNLYLSKNKFCQELKKEFSRFLAAYYLNFPLVFCKDKNQKFPNLFQWSEKTKFEILKEGYVDVDRKFITSTLATDYCPKSVLFLLLKSDLILEAIFFSDFFNDYRSRLLLRFYADVVLGTTVFDSCCLDLVEDLLDLVNNARFHFQKPQDVFSSIDSHLDSIIELTVLFDNNLINELQYNVVKKVEFLFSGLSPRVPIHIQLPRPPVYVLPVQFGEKSEKILPVQFGEKSEKILSVQFGEKSEKILPVQFGEKLENETITWNNLYFFTHLYISLLQKTNVLDSIIHHVNTIVENCTKESQYYRQDEKISEETVEIFLSFVLMILRMNYRDTLSIAERENWDIVDLIEENYANLYPSEKAETCLEIFQQFVESSSEADLEQISMLLCFLKENYGKFDVFLPPYSVESHNDWKKYFLSTSVTKFELKKEPESSWMTPDPVTVKSEDFKKLQFLSKKWKSVSLKDPSLIHICLRITTEELFTVDPTTVFQQFSIKEEINSEISEKKNSEKVDFDLDEFEKEIKKERKFINNLSVLDLDGRLLSVKIQKFPVQIQNSEIFKNQISHKNSATVTNLDFNEILKKDLEDINSRLQNIRGLSVFKKDHEEIPNDLLQYANEAESSKRHKSQSKARQKRDKIRESRRSSSSTQDGSSPQSNPVEIAPENHQRDILHIKRKDYQGDLSYGRRKDYQQSPSSSTTKDHQQDLPYSKQEDYQQDLPYSKQEDYQHDLLYSKQENHQQDLPYSKQENHQYDLSQDRQTEYQHDLSYSRQKDYLQYPLQDKQKDHQHDLSHSRRKDYLQDVEILPEPKLPILDKLDLSQLSPPPQKLEERTWNQIEVFSANKSVGEVVPLDQSIPSLELGSSSRASGHQNLEEIPEKTPKIIPQKTIEYPLWLKLLPPKDDDSGRPSTGTSRLLDLETAIRSNRSASSTKKEFFEPLRSHDSGFLEVTTSNRKNEKNEKKEKNEKNEKKEEIGFSCTMTEAQINDLMGICN